MTDFLFIVAVSILSGLVFGRIAKFFKLPNVTGYLIAGLLLGPFVLGVLSESTVRSFDQVSDIALGFIAFTIGLGFKLSYFKQVGAAPMIIAVFESFGAVILIVVTMILLGVDPALAILLGAIAAATAPAQTIMVIKQYKAKGPVTSMLLSVAALDDAVALIAFGFAVTIVKVLTTHTVISVMSILQPLYEIGISFVLGGALAFVMKLFLKWFKKPRNRICVAIGIILIASWLAKLIEASPLLTCMALGGVLVNIFDDIESIVDVADSFTPPIYMLFFFMSGAGFDITALSSVGLIGLVYIVMRVVGKMAGAWLGGKLSRAGKTVCRYLGPTLMPQAGVAIGLLMVAGSLLPEYAPELRAIILCSTFVYSIIGPSVAKSALTKAGEIVEQEKGLFHKLPAFFKLHKKAS